MTLLIQAIAGFLPWVREEATLPLATMGAVLSLILGLVFFMAIVTGVKLKQDRRRFDKELEALQKGYGEGV